MDYRVWFGGKSKHAHNGANLALNELLELYAQALTRYFGVAPNQPSITALIDEVRGSKLSLGQSMFLEWFLKNGISGMKQLASIDLVQDDQLQAEIEYENFILKEEYNSFDYPDDVRSCLISIATDLLERIQSGFKVIDSYAAAVYKDYEVQEFYSVPIFKESAEMQTLYFIC